jgi:chromosome segregation ATPase
MANGVLTLLKDIHRDKQGELERDYYQRREEIERQLAKENSRFRKLTGEIKAKNEQISKLREEIDRLEEAKKGLFPKHWDAKTKAEEILKNDYLKLRVKTTLNGIPREQVKKMIVDFHNRDYLAEAMGA